MTATLHASVKTLIIIIVQYNDSIYNCINRLLHGNTCTMFTTLMNYQS